MKKILQRIIHTYFTENLDFRARIFNILGFLGITLGIFFAVLSFFIGASYMLIGANLLASAAGAFMIYRANRSGNFKPFFLITVIGVFFILFPIMFFSGGGYQSGMPSFFIFAVVFTVIMLEGRRRAVFTILEIILYLGCLFIAYYFPQTIIPLDPDDVAIDIITSCIVAAAVLAFAIWQHLIIYDHKQKQLEHFDRKRSELFANISHEMKTPLSVISTYAQLLKNKMELLPQAEGSVENAMLIISEANRLGMIVSQVLELARMQEVNIKQDLKPCHIGEIISEAVSSHFTSAAENNNHNRIDLKIDDDLPMILADAPRIAQLVVNLIANAIRHTKGGLITVSARTSSAGRKKGNIIVLSVQDTGKGITQEEAKMIFDRWYTSAGGTGTGLGLFICKHIAEIHGGEISIESEPGKGSCFNVILPVNTSPC